MTQKFVMGSPLYRQEHEMNRQGIPLSRQTMSNWILRATTEYLHTDRYAGYHNLPEQITVVGCWAHARRKFDEAFRKLIQKQYLEVLDGVY